MKRYHYFLRMRPPEPGAIPKEGLVSVTNRDIWYDGMHYWGEAVYDRELTKEETNHYDLEYHKTRLASTL